MIRTSTLGECLVIVIFHEDDPEKRKALMDHLVEKFPNITSLQYVINHKANSFFLDLDAFGALESCFAALEDAAVVSWVFFLARWDIVKRV